MVLRNSGEQGDSQGEHILFAVIGPEIMRACARAFQLIRLQDCKRLAGFGDDLYVRVDQLFSSDPIRLTQREAPSSSGSASSCRDTSRECRRAWPWPWPRELA